MKYDLTLAKIKNTNFDLLYNRFIVGENLSEKQYESVLASAICFTYANDINVQQLGYRIIVEYYEQTLDNKDTINPNNNKCPVDYELISGKCIRKINKYYYDSTLLTLS